MSKKLYFGVAALVFAMVLFGYSPAGALNPCAAIDLAPPGISLTINTNADVMNAPFDFSAQISRVPNSSPPPSANLTMNWALSMSNQLQTIFTTIPGDQEVNPYHRLAWIDFSTDTQYIEYQAGKDILHNKMLIEDLANSSPPLSANLTTDSALSNATSKAFGQENRISLKWITGDIGDPDRVSWAPEVANLVIGDLSTMDPISRTAGGPTSS
ncbi:MAG: hypothetical protein WC495_02460 [Patescibacteria group bacterium]|jgi:hypothetical protein